MAAQREKARMSTSEFEAGLMDLDGASEFINMMIYGDSGVGKTVAASQLPGRVLYLAGEPGYISAARQGARGQVRLIPDTSAALAALLWLEDGNASRYDWIVPDGLSTLNNKWLLNFCAEAYDTNPASRTGRGLPAKPDYYHAQNFTKSFAARLVDLPANVLFTAHAMRPEGDSGETLVYPAIQGKVTEVSNYVAGLMHVVGYMAIRIARDTPKSTPHQVRRILWKHWFDEENDVRYFAKDQFDALGRVTDIYDAQENPTGMKMSDIIALCSEAEKPKAKTRKGRGKGPSK
jgi:hypothetical protein